MSTHDTIETCLSNHKEYHSQQKRKPHKVHYMDTRNGRIVIQLRTFPVVNHVCYWRVKHAPSVWENGDFVLTISKQSNILKTRVLKTHFPLRIMRKSFDTFVVIKALGLVYLTKVTLERLPLTRNSIRLELLTRQVKMTLDGIGQVLHMLR